MANSRIVETTHEELIRATVQEPPRKPKELTWREAEEVIEEHHVLHAQIAPLKQDLLHYVETHECMCRSGPKWRTCTRCRIEWELRD
jgi:hypothetical protein